jgi:hypothetical protein
VDLLSLENNSSDDGLESNGLKPLFQLVFTPLLIGVSGMQSVDEYIGEDDDETRRNPLKNFSLHGSRHNCGTLCSADVAGKC